MCSGRYQSVQTLDACVALDGTGALDACVALDGSKLAFTKFSRLGKPLIVATIMLDS